MIPEFLREVLAAVHDPCLDLPLSDARFAAQLDAAGTLKLTMPYPSAGIHGALRELILNKVPEGTIKAVEIGQHMLAAMPHKDLPALPGVRNVIAVGSGKGGVGKSTVTTNLALALVAEGARVGVLDADIYGPSQGIMFGLAAGERPEIFAEKQFVPIRSQGVQVMSMAFLVTEKTPMVWRGPMASGALLQMAQQTRWDDLDYLLVDLPPGTGDIQLTLAQKLPVCGAVVVTTPQNIAVLDARKGIEMFRKVDIPVLGIVENMSLHVCSQCGHVESLFGEGGGERLADEFEVMLLGQVPLHADIRRGMDAGKPPLTSEPDSEVSRRFASMARRMTALLSLRENDPNRQFSSVIGRA